MQLAGEKKYGQEGQGFQLEERGSKNGMEKGGGLREGNFHVITGSPCALNSQLPMRWG